MNQDELRNELFALRTHTRPAAALQCLEGLENALGLNSESNAERTVDTAQSLIARARLADSAEQLTAALNSIQKLQSRLSTGD
jgi:hypothetical protein